MNAIGIFREVAAWVVIQAMAAERTVAVAILDRTCFGAAIEVEVIARWHARRARALNADVYCCYHACDMKDCAAEHEE